jgi:thiol-disulfide isomerase/thioredoxin
MRSLRLWLLAVAAVAFVVAVALFAAACGTSGSSSGSGAPADVTFVPVDEFKVANYAGKPLVVNVFGTWCGPCNSEAPELAEFAKANPQAQFVGVAEDDTEDTVSEFMGKYELSYPVVLDDKRLGNMWGTQYVPTTIFFNASGQEVDRIVGAASLKQFEASLAKAQ